MEAEFDWEVWITAEGDPLIRKVAPDLGKSLRKAPERLGVHTSDALPEAPRPETQTSGGSSAAIIWRAQVKELSWPDHFRSHGGGARSRRTTLRRPSWCGDTDEAKNPLFPWSRPTAFSESVSSPIRSVRFSSRVRTTNT
jgi:hypothetical protein